jgi:hypothetical protein
MLGQSGISFSASLKVVVAIVLLSFLVLKAGELRHVVVLWDSIPGKSGESHAVANERIPASHSPPRLKKYRLKRKLDPAIDLARADKPELAGSGQQSIDSSSSSGGDSKNHTEDAEARQKMESTTSATIREHRGKSDQSALMEEALQQLGKNESSPEPPQQPASNTPVTVSIVTPAMPGDISSGKMETCFQSIVNQTLQPKEIVALLSGTDDEMCKRMHDLARRVLPDSIAFRANCTRPKLNQAESRNAAVLLATGDVCIFHDADDEMHHEKVEIVTMLFTQIPGLQVRHTSTCFCA